MLENEIEHSKRERYAVAYLFVMPADETLSSSGVQGYGREKFSDDQSAWWLSDAEASVRSLVLLNEGWDSYHAAATQESAIKNALRLVQVLAQSFAPRPTVVPTTEGGVRLEWYKDGVEAHLEVGPDSPELQLFYDNPSKHISWEGPLRRAPLDMGEILALFV